jgi:hypothetical protein
MTYGDGDEGISPQFTQGVKRLFLVMLSTARARGILFSISISFQRVDKFNWKCGMRTLVVL